MIRQIQEGRKISENTKNYMKLLKQYQMSKLRKENVDFTNPEDRQTIILVLHNKKDRSNLELEYLKRAFHSLKFFQEKKEQLSEKAQLMIYQSLSYHLASKNSVLFHYGDPGDTYYIILKGSVSILIPNKKHKNNYKSGKLSYEIVRKKFEQRKYDYENVLDLTPRAPESPRKRNLLNLQHMQSIEDLSEIDIMGNLFESQEQKRPSIKSENNKLSNKLQRQSVDAFSSLGQNEEEEKRKNRQSQQMCIKEDDLESQESMEEETDDFEACVFPDLQRVKIMSAGEAFGEIALVSNEKRTATVFVRENTEFATINRAGFQKILKAYHDTLKTHKIQDLISIPFKCFKKLYNDILEELVQIIEIKTFKFSEVIYKQNQDADFVYFIINGQVELSISRNSQLGSAMYSNELKKMLGENIPKSSEECVRIASVISKQVFGWEELINGSKRIYKATAVEETQLYILNSKQFIQLLSECRPFLEYFLQQETLLQDHRSDFMDKFLKQKVQINLRYDKKQVEKLKQSIKNQSVGSIGSENTKIYLPQYEQQLQQVSHVKNMEAFKNAMSNRKENLKSLTKQIHKPVLESEPMFPIPAEKVLAKRLSAIHLKYSVIQGESFENKKYKNYIYSSTKNMTSEVKLTEDKHNYSDEQKQPELFKSRSQRTLHNLLQMQSKGFISKLPAISEHEPQRNQSAFSQLSKPQTITSQRGKGQSLYSIDQKQNQQIRKLLGSRKEKQMSIIKRYLNERLQ